MTAKNILYVEDDEALSFLVIDHLQLSGFEVIHCCDGQQALEQFKAKTVDLCILDIMIPAVDGFALATEIRKINFDIPIIFLSAKTLKEDRIKGLKLGADDYMVKPFSLEELLLKIDIFLRRAKKSHEGNPSTYQIGKFSFNHKNYELNHALHKIRLTEKEANLLRFFIENKNKVLKREEILLQLWGDDDYFLGRSLDVFISRLRKIFTEEKKVQFKNIHGIGFKFIEQEE